MIFKNVNKILILKLCCLGDMVFILPAISNLKRNFPDAKITLISSSWVKNIYKYIPDVNNFLIFDPPFKGGFINKISSAYKLIRLIKKEKFDLALSCHRDSSFGTMLMLSGIRYRLGFKNTSFINYFSEYDDTVHETLRYLNILTENGLKVTDIEPTLTRIRNIESVKDKNDIPKDSVTIGIFPFGGINPGTVMKIKRWDLNNYFKIIEMLTQEHPEYNIILLEGTHEDEKFDSTAKFPGNVKIHSIINNDLMYSCNVFLSADTGALHLAAAFGIHTIGLFGPSDPRLVAPLNYDNVIFHKYIWKQPECSPCYTPQTSIDRNNKTYYKGNEFLCNTGTHECMKTISVDEVFSSLKEILGKINLT